eukprot:gnl/Carplike_NY0171/2776_a3728_513.p1 GENE.gnl/Carplike_NY0171/2776_a3728_513~~gnl/Carplike_NY0171/2776_a3728_513.p1  ORF type:complete len:156 (+),score=2.45 gnl/Carplike_NY0171/2776_a3728_513:42-509(+)
MRKKIVFILLLFYLPGTAQSDYLPFSREKSRKAGTYTEYADFTLGYVTKSPYQAFKANISVNNILFRRFGFYSSFEAGADTFYSIYGMTTTIIPRIYFFAGVDCFGKNGLLNGEKRDPRKEVGLGLVPYKWFVIRMSYSDSVGPSVSAGVKVSLG